MPHAPNAERGTGEDQGVHTAKHPCHTWWTVWPMRRSKGGPPSNERFHPTEPGIASPRLAPPPTGRGRPSMLGRVTVERCCRCCLERPLGAPSPRSERPFVPDGSSDVFPIRGSVLYPAGSGRLSVCSTDVASIAIQVRIACPRRSVVNVCWVVAHPADAGRPGHAPCGPFCSPCFIASSSARIRARASLLMSSMR